MHKVTVALCFALFCGIYAAPLEEDLVKRLLEALEEKEKREFYIFNYFPDKEELKVQYTVCVNGDKSKTPCRPVTNHVLTVTDSNGKKVFGASEDYLDGYVGPSRTYNLKLNSGQDYTVMACEKKADGGLMRCNKGTIKGGGRSGGFGKYVNLN